MKIMAYAGVDWHDDRQSGSAKGDGQNVSKYLFSPKWESFGSLDEWMDGQTQPPRDRMGRMRYGACCCCFTGTREFPGKGFYY